MKNLVLILPKKENTLFSPKMEFEQADGFTKLYLKDSKAALKKALKFINEQTAIVARDAVNMKALRGSLIKYNMPDEEKLIGFTGKAIEEAIRKNEMRLPLYEIYIISHPLAALKIIEKIKSYAKIFTIVTKESFDISVFDEIYFKYGIIIRHLSKINKTIGADSIIISTDSNDEIAPWIKNPVISLANKCSVTDALMLRKAALEGIKNDFLTLWGGEASVSLCSLLNIEEEENVYVNSIKKCDDIFMLDIKGI